MMSSYELSRRAFLKTAGALTAAAAFGGMPAFSFGAQQRMATFPEKTNLILLTARPPQLETPLALFKDAVTPNEAVFVRWHISQLPTAIDLTTWRLKIGGNTEKELSLSMDDLKSFEKAGYTAVIQCSGNSRSFFEPRVLGGQWGHGAMGNVTWAGARLKDVLAKAGIKTGSVEVVFDGLDTPPLASVPDVMKSLPVDKAIEDDIIIAYEMNGKALPMLNGFPARLVVPGWYATYWVKSLASITVVTKPFEGFWMKTAYRIPDTDCGCVEPGTTPKKTIPIHRMTTRSLIIDPAESSTIKGGRPVEIMGIAFSGGHSIRDVIVSVDGGSSWRPARLGKDMGKYSWIHWFFPWTPEKPGKYTLMAKATNSIGESQPFEGLWNPAGYLWNKVERHEVVVI
ncbi:MAG TPA: molybdopterin-dependent oxidoreductase [Dissulfurispiraceae bacterium]|nr:molybdopterin-dependent oxidoreductase [Dissulfurispiraceae bacterium]